MWKAGQTGVGGRHSALSLGSPFVCRATALLAHHETRGAGLETGSPSCPLDWLDLPGNVRRRRVSSAGGATGLDMRDAPAGDPTVCQEDVEGGQAAYVAVRLLLFVCLAEGAAARTGRSNSNANYHHHHQKHQKRTTATAQKFVPSTDAHTEQNSTIRWPKEKKIEQIPSSNLSPFYGLHC